MKLKDIFAFKDWLSYRQKDCHNARTMDLRPARTALYEAFARHVLNVKNASHQEMRSLVCALCHVEYYFIKPNDEKMAAIGLDMQKLRRTVNSSNYSD